MSVRIVTVRQGDCSALRIEGRLLAEDVDVLQRAVSEAGDSVLLDFTNLHGTDDVGLQTILRLVAEGNPIVAASQYLKLRLQRGADDRGTKEGT